MVVIARMLARKTFVLGILVAALFMVVSTFAGTSRAEQLVASWYGVGDGFAGRTTANGETFDPYAYTAAHKTLPFGTKLAVTYQDRTAVVRINDRGPYIEGRDLDLSYAAADYIGLVAAGSAPVNVEYVDESTPVGPYQASAPEPEPEPEPSPEPEPQPEQQFAPESEEAPAPEPDPETTEPESQGFSNSQATTEEPAQSAEEEQYEDPAGDQYEDGNVGGRESEAVTQGPQVAADQYGAEPDASGDQYADEGQYDDNAGLPPAQSPVSPADSGPEQPEPPQPSPATVAPEASELQEPPAELVKPGSTVEHRIELDIAAAPSTATESPETPAPTQAAGAGAAVDNEAPVQSAEREGDEFQESGESTTEDGAAEEQGSGDVEIERLPDTGGWIQPPNLSPADIVAVLLVAFVLKAGLHRMRA